jgi:hypothetical protein
MVISRSHLRFWSGGHRDAWAIVTPWAPVYCQGGGGEVPGEFFATQNLSSTFYCFQLFFFFFFLPVYPFLIEIDLRCPP